MADQKYPEDSIIDTQITRLQEVIDRMRNSHYQYDCIQYLESDGKNPCKYCSAHKPDCQAYSVKTCTCGANVFTFEHDYTKIIKKGNKV